MQEALDIYIKLLIAIISFIAPLLINLLSIFSDGIAVKKRTFQEYETQTTKILKEKINQKDVNVTELITKESAAFEKKKNEIAIQLDLLDPKKQIKKIFPTFFYSLFLIILNRLFSDTEIVKSLNWGESNIKSLVGVSFIVSIGFAISGVVRLYNVAWAVIEVKQEIAEDKARESSKAEKIISTDEITPIEKI